MKKEKQTKIDNKSTKVAKISKLPQKKSRFYSSEDIRKIREAMELYIQNTDIPIVSEFAYQLKVRRAFLYEREDFEDLMESLLAKKEAQLEKLSLFNVVNTTMAIFSLKNMGWSDRQDIEVSGKGGEAIKVIWE